MLRRSSRVRQRNDDKRPAVDYKLPKSMFKRIIAQSRFSIISLNIVKDVAHKVELPGALKRLNVVARDYNYPFDLPEALEELSFEWYCQYRQPLVLPDNLRKLQVIHLNSLPFTLPPGLVELRLMWHYVGPLVLPDGLKRLHFAPQSRFNLPVTLPAGLTSVHFGGSYNQPTILPPCIEELGVGAGFTHELSLPNTLRKIEWWSRRPIQIPEGVIEIAFDAPFNQPVTFPASLQKVVFGASRHSHPLNFPAGLKELLCHLDEYDGLVLPDGLQKLTWWSTMGVRLPTGLRELIKEQHSPLVLPEGLVKLTSGRYCGGHYDLPQSVQQMEILQYATFTHPSILQHLIVGYSNNVVDLSNNKVHKMTVAKREIRLRTWPQELEELAFTVDTLEYPLWVPEGCRMVGRRPANVIME